MACLNRASGGCELRGFVMPRIGKPSPKVKQQANSATAPSDALGVRDIIAFRYQALPLSHALENFSCVLAKEPTRFPASVEQPRDPPPNRDIAAQIREL